MSNGNSSNHARWLAWAEEDLFRVNILMGYSDVRGCMSHLQQASEKYLKGKLIENGWRLKRLHNIETLLSEAREHGINCPMSDEVASLLTSQYTASRYPGEGLEGEEEEELTMEDVRECMVEVSDMMGKPPGGEESDEGKDLYRPGFGNQPPPIGGGGIGGH